MGGMQEFIASVTAAGLRKKGKPPVVSGRKFWPERWELELEEVVRDELTAAVSMVKKELQANMKARAVHDSDDDYISAGIYDKLEDIAEHVVEFNTVTFANFSGMSVGERYIPDTPGKEELIRQWRDTMVMSMKTASMEAKRKASVIVEEGVMRGFGRRQITQQLEDALANFPRAKANLIARTEMGKLNSAIAQAQSQSAGVEMYEWSCAMDGRTRESHGLLEGKICRWDDPNVYSTDGGKTWKQREGKMFIGHPGTDFNCRCTALPYLPELEDEFEKARPSGDVRGVVQTQENLKPVRREKPKRRLTAREVLGIIREEQEQIPAKLQSLLRDAKNTISDEAKNNDFGLKVQAESESVLDSLKKVNPNYKPGSTSWSMNCANCVNAYVARRRGFDVSAKSFDRKGEHSEYRIPEKENAGFLSAFENPEFINVGNDGFDVFEKKILDNAQKCGNGAIFILSGMSESMNHVIILENIGGKLLFIDPQDSTVSKKIPFKMYSYDGYSRVDELKFSKKLKFYTRNWS